MIFERAHIELIEEQKNGLMSLQSGFFSGILLCKYLERKKDASVWRCDFFREKIQRLMYTLRMIQTGLCNKQESGHIVWMSPVFASRVLPLFFRAMARIYPEEIYGEDDAARKAEYFLELLETLKNAHAQKTPLGTSFLDDIHMFRTFLGHCSEEIGKELKDILISP